MTSWRGEQQAGRRYGEAAPLHCQPSEGVRDNNRGWGQAGNEVGDILSSAAKRVAL